MKLWGTLFLAIITMTNSVKPAHAAWDLNDVSYLFPLPLTSDPEDFLLKATAKGKYGQLLPQPLFDQLVLLAGDRHQAANVPITDMRVLAARIDPCFHMVDGETTCHRQIRFVWQPLEHMGTDNVTANDGTIHSFYDLNESEFKTLLTELQALKSKNDAFFPWGMSTKGESLGVHPAFQNVKTRASFAAELKKILLSHTGSSQLVRVTSVRRPNISPWWVFFGVDFPNGWSPTAKGEDIVIPRVNQKTQEYFNLVNYDQFKELRGAMVPNMHKAPDNMISLIEHYDTGVKDPATYYQPAVNALQKIENPNTFSPANMDCIHCHITSSIKEWTKTNRPKVSASIAAKSPLKYGLDTRDEFNLNNTTFYDGNTMILRSFGYYNAFPVTSDRVIFESAEVAKLLNQGAI